MLEVLRSQYPVGQGCFHAGCVKLHDGRSNETPEFNYVYDCGATRQNVVKEAIDFYRIGHRHVDALFVSHLHEDHVGGIDRLLGAVSVGAVYIPYSDDLLPVLDVIEADLEGVLTASYVEAKIDPESWFGRRGVSRVVRVMSHPGGDVPPDEDGIGPVEPKAPVGFDAAIQARELTRRFRRSERTKMESGEVLLVSQAVRPYDWVLVPHVDPAPRRNVQNFNQAIRKACGLPRYARLTSPRLVEALRDRAKRRALRKCYEKIISGGAGYNHNRISMSLYSGPSARRNEVKSEYAISRSASAAPYWMSGTDLEHNYLMGRGAIGWIGTGDAILCKEEVRKAWRHTYRPYDEHIATLLLPHHGSRKNFHTDLLNFPSLQLCIAAAGKSSRYKHPSLAVVEGVRARGKLFCHVSQDPRSAVHERVLVH